MNALQAIIGSGAAAAQPPPAAAQQAPAAAAGPISGNALLQALQAAMGGAQAPAQQQQQQQYAPAPATAPRQPRADKHAATPRPSGPPPAWTKQAESWVPTTALGYQNILLGAAAVVQGGTVQAACTQVLGQTVALDASPGGGGGAVHILLVPEPPAGLKLTATAIDGALARIPPGSSLVLALQAAWLRAAEVLAADKGVEVTAVMQLWQARLAAKAAHALASDDEDDLFFAEGRQRGTFLQALVRWLGGRRGRAGRRS